MSTAWATSPRVRGRYKSSGKAKPRARAQISPGASPPPGQPSHRHRARSSSSQLTAQLLEEWAALSPAQKRLVLELVHQLGRP